MSIRKIISTAIIGIVGFSGVFAPVSTAFAADEARLHDTFAVKETDDEATINFGSNLLVAGNNIINEQTVKGLLFSAGNQLDLKAGSEYAFLAGNSINFKGRVEKDIFLAGNLITIDNGAKIGRDTFATGNIVNLSADLVGDFSAAANRVVLNNVNINGNVNLDVAEIIFEGKVNIDGKLVVNSDADISGISNVTYAEIEKYEPVDIDVTATEIMVAKIYGIISLFIVMVVIFALFPRTQAKIERELNGVQFGKDLLIGMCTLLFVPVIAIFLLISLIGAPLAIILIAVYVISLYVAQAFTGVWLGKIIVEKVAKTKVTVFVEGLIGITILALAVMIPYFGTYIGLLSMLLGLGLIMQSINTRGRRYTEYVETNAAIKNTKTTKAKKVKKSKDE